GGADEDGRVHAAHDLSQADAAAGPISRPLPHLGGGPCVGDLEVTQAGHVVGEQAVAVQAPEPCPCRGGVQPVAGHGRPELVGDADARGAGAEDDHAVLGERDLAGMGAGQYGGEVDRAGALHVVVEGEYVGAVAVQNAPGVAGAEVLPVQQRVGEDLQRGGDVGADEGVVGLLRGPPVPYAQIQRVLEQFRPVGADVQHHRQGAGRVDAARRGVDGELTGRDVDAADAPVADAEDGLGVGGDDEVDLVSGQLGGAQGGLDLVRRIDAEIDA